MTTSTKKPRVATKTKERKVPEAATADASSPKPRAPRKTRAAKAKPVCKTGTVAIIGRANVGKSTLVNLLVQYKLAAVSPKPQTTRHKILGVLNGKDYQVVFYDTPGMPFKTGDVLDRRLLGTALGAIHDVNLVLMLVEPRLPGDVETRIIKDLKTEEKPAILAINKVDRARKEALLPVMEAYSRAHPFLEIMPISALTNDGVEELLKLIVKHLPEGEPEYAPDEITDRTERFLSTEIIREQVFNAYAEEVPYAVAVEIENFVESSEDHGGKDYVSAVLYVDKDSQKAILIGKGGLMLKNIGAAARQRIEELLERGVYLEMWVKVYPKWRKDKAFLERIGY